jgi:hypothetical protein
MECAEECHGGHARQPPVSTRSLAFKRWAHGRCFRCLARDHLVRDCCEPFRCLGCLRQGHRERDCRRRPVMSDAPSCDPRTVPHGSRHARSWTEVVAAPPMGGDRSDALRHSEVHGIFRLLKSATTLVMLVGMMLVSVKALIRVHWMSYCRKLSRLSWCCFVRRSRTLWQRRSGLCERPQTTWVWWLLWSLLPCASHLITVFDGGVDRGQSCGLRG